MLIRGLMVLCSHIKLCALSEQWDCSLKTVIMQLQPEHLPLTALELLWDTLYFTGIWQLLARSELYWISFNVWISIGVPSSKIQSKGRLCHLYSFSEILCSTKGFSCLRDIILPNFLKAFFYNHVVEIENSHNIRLSFTFNDHCPQISTVFYRGGHTNAYCMEGFIAGDITRILYT